MAENLKAFENLKENENASLSSQEKVDLRKISPDDIKSQKEKVGSKIFKVGGRPMTLKNIVKNLTFDEEGGKAELKINGKKVAIGWQSELGAAIQVYAIAHNKTIGGAGIDGKVGKDTVRGLQSTQNSVKAEEAKKQNERVSEDDEKTSRLSSLLRADYRSRVGKYNDKKYNLLNTTPGDTEGALKSALRNGSSETISIKYKSAIDGKFQTVKINAGGCKEGNNYSANKFGKAIDNAITRKEAELKKAEDARIAKEKLNAKQEAIVKAVESFDITKFSAKAQAYLREKNFVFGNRLDIKDGLGTGIAFDKGNLHFGDAFYIPKAQVDSFYTNGQFNAAKFKSILGPNLDKWADKHFIAKADKLANQLKNHTVTMSTIPASEIKIRNTEAGMKRIADLGVKIPEADQQVLDSKKNSLQVIKDYKDISGKAEGRVKYIEDALNRGSIRRLSRAEENKLIKEAQSTYNMLVNKTASYRGADGKLKNVYNVYKKMVNGEKSYQKLVDRYKKVKDM